MCVYLQLPHIVNKTSSTATFVLSYNTTSMTGMVTSTVYNIKSMTSAHIHAVSAASSGHANIQCFEYIKYARFIKQVP